jgi:hypothetical protein
MASCPAGHELAGAGRPRACPRCRREAVAELAAAVETSLPRPVIEAAVAAVAPSGQALSQLAAALAADPGVLARGAPPAAGRLAADAHPRPRAADHLRQMLITGGVLPPRDEELARTGRWLAALLDSVQPAGHRQLVHAFATWHVIRRLRHRAQTASRPRTYTASARREIKAAAAFLAWLAARGTTLAACRQADIDGWLATGPAACNARGFVAWAAGQGHCPALEVPRPARQAGTAISPEQRWELVTRLLHDGGLQVTDRVAGCLVLLFGQNMTRIAALTTSDVISRGQDVSVRLGRHEVPVPSPLGRLLLTLIHDGKPYTGIGSRPGSRWLFPGLLPGRPITPARLAERLRALGIPAKAGRRAALIGLAAQIPAAVLADLLGLHPTTAVTWMRQAGGDWSRYAAHLAQTRNHQP